METIATKIGGSFAVMCAALLLRRYLFRSTKEAIICLIATEVAVFLIVLWFTGLLSLDWFAILFNLEWLFTVTWNVAVAYIIGMWVGDAVSKKTANPLGFVSS